MTQSILEYRRLLRLPGGPYSPDEPRSGQGTRPGPRLERLLPTAAIGPQGLQIHAHMRQW